MLWADDEKCQMFIWLGKSSRTVWLLKNSSAKRGPKIASRQDALQTIFSGRLGIFYPPKSSRFYGYRVLQHPQARSLIELLFGAFSKFRVDGRQTAPYYPEF